MLKKKGEKKKVAWRKEAERRPAVESSSAKVRVVPWGRAADALPGVRHSRGPATGSKPVLLCANGTFCSLISCLILSETR